MSVKQFFKGKAFKCIMTLTAILLVCGVLLAICWGFLEVTDDERFNRKIGDIYGGDKVTATEVTDLGDWNTKVNGATIQKMWYIAEKNDYLVQAASRGNGGDIICWIAVNLNEEKTDVAGIGKVLLYGVGDPAEFTGNIPSSLYEKFGKEYTDGKLFQYGTKGTDEFIETGASYTMTAICNDVNGAVAFVKAYISGTNIEAEYKYADFINIDDTTWTTADGETTYNIVTTNNGMADAFTFAIKVKSIDGTPKITAYGITVNGSTSSNSGKYYGDDMSDFAKDLTGKTLADIEAVFEAEKDLGRGEGENLHTGATKSNELCLNAAAFALANYEKCSAEDKLPEVVPGPYDDFEYTDLIDIDATAWTNDNGEITYEIVTTANGKAEEFTIEIKVNSVNGTPTVTAYEIKVNGSTSNNSGHNYGDDMSDFAKNLTGKTLADIEAVLEAEKDLGRNEGENLHTGATKSNELCLHAAAFALANYEKCATKDKKAFENYEYTEFIDMGATAWTNDNGEITYEIVTTANGRAEEFTIEIKVNSVNGTPTVTAYEIKVNGSTSSNSGHYYGDDMSDFAKNLTGKTLADIEAVLEAEKDLGRNEGENLHTGATKSNELCLHAAAFALANYATCLTADKEAN